MIDRRWVSYGPPNYPFKLNRDSPQARGLVGWWPMLTSPGASIVKDLSGNHFDGTITGNLSWINQHTVGSMLDFPGNRNNYLSLGDYDALTSNEFSVSVWMTWNGSPTQGAWATIASKGTITTDEFDIIMQADEIRFYIDATLAVTWNPGVVPTGLHLFTGVYSRSAGTAKIFYDGKEQASAAFSNIITNSTSNLILGQGHPSTWGYPDNLGELRYYDRALSPIDVLDQYRNPWELYRPIHQPIGFVPIVAAGAIMNQIQGPNVGADLFDGTILIL